VDLAALLVYNAMDPVHGFLNRGKSIFLTFL
jgi:hypothetical protein